MYKEQFIIFDEVMNWFRLGKKVGAQEVLGIAGYVTFGRLLWWFACWCFSLPGNENYEFI